ncbi:MAG: hypothetical protein V1784_02155, partial [bacterium]
MERFPERIIASPPGEILGSGIQKDHLAFAVCDKNTVADTPDNAGEQFFARFVLHVSSPQSKKRLSLFMKLYFLSAFPENNGGKGLMSYEATRSCVLLHLDALEHTST